MLTVRLRLSQRLTDENHTPTSPADRAYNCFGWAAGSFDVRIDPNPPDEYAYGNIFWPDGLPRNYSKETFIELYRRYGFETCEDGEIEDGFQKIVLFVAEDEVTHASRQLVSGQWASKLGFEDLDIVHIEEGTLAGGRYGEPAIYMKRPRTESDPEPPSVAKMPPNPLYLRNKER